MASSQDEAPPSAIRSMETTHQPLLVLRCKVVVVGEATVGKSALVQMFHSGGHTYPKNYVMTLGVDFCVKVCNIPESPTAVELYLHDCAGQSIFNQRDLGTRHWEGASMVAVVYDVSNRESFTSCAKWLAGVRSMRPNNPIGGVLIGNKTDLREVGRGAVSREEGEAFARDNGLDFFECSAQNSYEEVEAPFQHIAQQFHRKYDLLVQRSEEMM